MQLAVDVERVNVDEVLDAAHGLGVEQHQQWPRANRRRFTGLPSSRSKVSHAWQRSNRRDSLACAGVSVRGLGDVPTSDGDQGSGQDGMGLGEEAVTFVAVGERCVVDGVDRGGQWVDVGQRGQGGERGGLLEYLGDIL